MVCMVAHPNKFPQVVEYKWRLSHEYYNILTEIMFIALHEMRYLTKQAKCLSL